jgi:hypothetical protein
MSYLTSLKRRTKIDTLESRFNEIHDALLKYLGPVEYGHAILSDKYPEGKLGDLTQKYLREASEARDEVKRLRAIEAKRKAGFLPPRDY